MIRMLKPFGGASALGLVALLAVGCGGSGEGGKASAAAPEKRSAPTAPNADATRVEVAVLSPTDATLDAVIPGEVEGSRDAMLASAQGGPVERVFVKEGQAIKQGKLLMHVDAALYTIQHKQAQNDLARAQREFDRAEGLGSALPKAERERREAEVTRLKNALELAELRLQRSKVKAPFSGVVSELHAEVGEVVAATAPLLHLIRLDPVKVVLSVPDRDVVALTPGTEVEVRVGARSGMLKGTIARISPTGDQDTRAFRAEVEVENPESTLLPGMIASVRVARTLAEGAVVIPQDWLVTRRDGVGVFIETGGIARYRPVVAGKVVRDQIVIDEGLDNGARLIVTGHRQLQDGDTVSIAREGACCKEGRAVFDQ